MKMAKELPVRTPRTPNFVRVGGVEWVPIEDFTDAQLRTLGKLWTKELIERAGAKRAEVTPKAGNKDG